ncbi:MAG: hypothetical protein KDM81_16620, partial [Verrucomicrobiae bacterium]|nr:hypothetical protein [Verrucomicrobiae bacterium]
MNTMLNRTPGAGGRPMRAIRTPGLRTSETAASMVSAHPGQGMSFRLPGRAGCPLVAFLLLATVWCAQTPARAQDSAIQYGRGVPFAVRLMTERSLKYLVETQLPEGRWPGQESG